MSTILLHLNKLHPSLQMFQSYPVTAGLTHFLVDPCTKHSWHLTGQSVGVINYRMLHLIPKGRTKIGEKKVHQIYENVRDWFDPTPPITVTKNIYIVKKVMFRRLKSYGKWGSVPPPPPMHANLRKSGPFSN